MFSPLTTQLETKYWRCRKCRPVQEKLQGAKNVFVKKNHCTHAHWWWRISFLHIVNSSRLLLSSAGRNHGLRNQKPWTTKLETAEESIFCYWRFMWRSSESNSWQCAFNCNLTCKSFRKSDSLQRYCSLIESLTKASPKERISFLSVEK